MIAAIHLLTAADGSVITSVNVIGTKLPVTLNTRVGQPYDTDAIAADLRHLWSTQRFEDVRVEHSSSTITFLVVETPLLTFIT